VDDDNENWADPGVPSIGSCCPGNSTDNDHGEREEYRLCGEQDTGRGKGTKDRKAKGNGKGKGNGTGKVFVNRRLGGDDISRVIAVQLKRDRYQADSDTEGIHERV
jgi:hypothetical protein